MKKQSKEKFNLITIGGATRDIMFFTDKAKIIPTPEDPLVQKILGFEYGAKVNIDKAYFMFGGGASNTAVSCSYLGLKTACVARVGDDENGRLMRDNLRKMGVNAEFIQTDKTINSGFSFIVSTKKSREHTAFLCRGANDNLQLTIKKLKQLNTKWLYVSSLTGKNWQENLNVIRSSLFAHRSSLRWAWNPGNIQLKSGRRGLSKFLKSANVLILNKDEAMELALSDKKQQIKDKKIDNIKSLLKILKDWGPKIVVITCGTNGAYVYDGQKVYHSPIYKTKRADTTGAGDVFGSSFIAGLILYDGRIEKALRLAIVNSGSVITRIGAQNGLLTRREAERLMNKIKTKIYNP